MGLYIPYRGTLTEPVHDVANKRITTIVTVVTAPPILIGPPAEVYVTWLRIESSIYININAPQPDAPHHLQPRIRNHLHSPIRAALASGNRRRRLSPDTVIAQVAPFILHKHSLFSNKERVPGVGRYL